MDYRQIVDSMLIPLSFDRKGEIVVAKEIEATRLVMASERYTFPSKLSLYP